MEEPPKKLLQVHRILETLLEKRDIQWTLANPNSLGQEPRNFGLVKATAATCVIVTALYFRFVGIPAFTEHITLLPTNLLALC